MSVFLIAQINIHDRSRYAEYEKGFMDILSRHGGRLVVVDEAPRLLEGSWDYTRTVVLAFQSEDDAQTWYYSDEYQQLMQHRLAVSDGNIVMVKALEGI